MSKDDGRQSFLILNFYWHNKFNIPQYNIQRTWHTLSFHQIARSLQFKWWLLCLALSPCPLIQPDPSLIGWLKRGIFPIAFSLCSWAFSGSLATIWPVLGIVWGHNPQGVLGLMQACIDDTWADDSNVTRDNAGAPPRSEGKQGEAGASSWANMLLPQGGSSVHLRYAGYGTDPLASQVQHKFELRSQRCALNSTIVNYLSATLKKLEYDNKGNLSETRSII